MARYYDALYSKIVDYEREINRVEKIFAAHRKKKVTSVLDVACGTGNYTFLFAKKGYMTLGVDVSPEMIEAAKGKLREKKNPRFQKMDMRALRLKEKFDAATVLFGGFGYLLGAIDVRKFLASARRSLTTGGLLIFEFWHDTAVLPSSSSESGNLSWDAVDSGANRIVRLNRGRFDASTNVLTIEFTYYVLSLAEKRIVGHFSEEHKLRTYSLPEIRSLLENSGYVVLGFYDAGLGGSKELRPALQSTFRVMAVARPIGKS